MRWWKKAPVVVDEEAQAARAKAEQQLREVQKQGRYVTRLTSALIERRALDPFGDEIQITFVPRGNHA